MKNTFLLVTLFLSLIIHGQNELKIEMIKIKTDKNIDPNKLTIKFSEGTWKVTLYPIFQNNQILKENFPKEAGIYNLTINYGENLFYVETVIYKTKPKFEVLEFDFYKENERIFCKIKSEQIIELNKEIVLNKLSEEVQNIINEIKK